MPAVAQCEPVYRICAARTTLANPGGLWANTVFCYCAAWHTIGLARGML